MTAEPLPPTRSAAPTAGLSSTARTRAGWSGLRLVPAGRIVAPRAPFAVLVLLLLAGALLTALLVNTSLAQNAFRLNDLATRGKALNQRAEMLQRHVEAAEAPAELSRRAQELGMVPYRNPLFLRLPDGALLGAPTAAAEPLIRASSPGSPPAAPGSTAGSTAPLPASAPTPETSPALSPPGSSTSGNSP